VVVYSDLYPNRGCRSVRGVFFHASEVVKRYLSRGGGGGGSCLLCLPFCYA